MHLKYYVVDAFGDAAFTGNPAGVCVLDKPLPAEMMQQIAAQNNLAETAFVYPEGKEYHLRWFTPVTEINLCGHATLATAFVLHKFYAPQTDLFKFHSKSGLLTVMPKDDLYELDFPAWQAKLVEITPEMNHAVGGIKEAHLARDLFLLLEDEGAVRRYQPDFAALAKILGCFAVVIMAKGDQCDFVSRMFAPNAGIEEDHVTGSTHSTLVPFWAKQLDKTTLLAKQLSKRGGTLYCEHCDDRVKIAGRARLYLTGELHLS